MKYATFRRQDHGHFHSLLAIGWNELNPVPRQRGIVNMIKDRWMMIDLEYEASRQVSIASEVNTTDQRRHQDLKNGTTSAFQELNVSTLAKLVMVIESAFAD